MRLPLRPRLEELQPRCLLSTFFVATTGNDSTGNGTLANPFAFNHAPLLANTQTLTLDPVLAGSPNPGTLVSAILASGGNPITDVDAGAQPGIALIGTDSAFGTWSFSTDGGVTWTTVAGVSSANALLLDSGPLTRLRFLPLPGQAGSVPDGITFRAWDGTTGTPGTYADTTTNGGQTAFSVMTAQAVITFASAPLTTTAVAVSAFERTALSNVPVATFTHEGAPEPASNFSATINWGDGTTSAGTVSLSGTTYSVAGSHTYLDEGSFSVTVTIIDGSTSTPVTKATVLEELLPDGTRGDANGRFVSEVYRNLLDRQVDPTGLGNFGGGLDSGALTRQQVALGVETSLEFLTDQVEGLYQKYLGRAADSLGLSNAVTALSAGASLEEVAAGLIGSPEFLLDNGNNTTGALQALYELALGRAIDSTGLSNASAALAGGASLTDVALGVLTSSEYRTLLVQGYYTQFLERQADSVGLANAMAALNAGASDQQVIAGIVSSDEFFNKTAS
jgi:hypothetical protein